MNVPLTGFSMFSTLFFSNIAVNILNARTAEPAGKLDVTSLDKVYIL